MEKPRAPPVPLAADYVSADTHRTRKPVAQASKPAVSQVSNLWMPERFLRLTD